MGKSLRTQMATLPEILRRADVAYGTLMVSSHPAFTTAASGCGLDFVFVDTEHVPLDRDELAQMCQTYSALGLPPLVRIPKADPVLARAVMDAGACGVVASYCETVEQVHDLRRAVKMKPLQGELLELAMSDPAKFEEENPKTAAFIKERNAHVALVLNIESRAAIRDLDKLLAVPGVDGVLIGPHDLSCSLGVPEDFASDEFQQAIKTIFEKARAAGVGAGIHQGMPPTTPGMTPEFASKWISEYGCNVYVHAADVNLFSTQLKTHLSQIQTSTGTLRENDSDSGPAQKRLKTEAAI